MTEREGGGARVPDDVGGDLPAVKARIDEVQRRKRHTVRWRMSRDTAERAIAAITREAGAHLSAAGKSRRRRRHKRLL